MGKSSKEPVPRILIADDDPCVVSVVADRCARLGFDVETASNGLQVLIKAGEQPPDILVIDVHMPEVDGLMTLAYLRDIVRKPIHVMVVTGSPGFEIAERCEGFDVSCIHKGRNFWTEFETGLVMLYPEHAAAIARSGDGSASPEIRKRPRVLLVDDDIAVKRLFFHRFANLGADLLYAADGVQAYWKARREQPSVIVTDYNMPNSNAEYLLARLRSTPQTRSIPVIVQSGRRLSEPIRRRLSEPVPGQAGAMRIIRKCADAGELFEALQRLCGFTGNLEGGLIYQ
ncbi:response regulator [Bradyrhizobium sp.]|uniref:response regulator n=1 Tax=Bradyrhizobium sp. TaxID=376 RepID=UPI003C5CCB1B